MANLEPADNVERSSMADEAEAALRHLILGGELVPGARLVELDLCEQLGASRTPVREALHRLELAGLAEPSGRGLCVAGLADRALDDAYRVRAVLEGLAARLAAERQRRGDLAPAALAHVEAVARTADRATRAGRLAEAIDANRAFHLGIVDLAGNGELRSALLPVWDRVQVTTRASLGEAPRTMRVDEEHAAILAAIRDGQGGTARRLAEAHVEGTRRLAVVAGTTSGGRAGDARATRAAGDRAAQTRSRLATAVDRGGRRP
jgi:DNA-binding GntR family transcriptional regulator